MASDTFSHRVAQLYRGAHCVPTEPLDDGPYYRPGAPNLTDLYPKDSTGPVLYLDATVADRHCKPIAGVTGEVWQADDAGRYDNEHPDNPPKPDFFRCRGTFTVADNGRFRLRTVLPGNYSVPLPDRIWVRVKHLHFKLYAHCYQPFTSEVQLLPDEHALGDERFRQGLGAQLERIPDEDGRPAYRTTFNFVLQPVAAHGYALAAARTHAGGPAVAGRTASPDKRPASSAIASDHAGHGASTPRTRDLVLYRDVQIDVIREGLGPLVVMLPSAGRDSEDFDNVAALIAARGFTVLRPQPRGIAASVGPMTGLTFHHFARDIATVIDRQCNGPAVVVGHAFGNWIARATATDCPHLVRGVVLAAAAKTPPFPPELPAAQAKCADTSLPDKQRLEALQLAFFAPGHNPSSWLTGWHRRAMLAQREAGAATPQQDWWNGGTAPILDLQAGKDPWRPRASANELSDALGARVTIAVIDDASHALLPEQPNAVADAIAGWIAGLGQA